MIVTMPVNITYVSSRNIKKILTFFCRQFFDPIDIYPYPPPLKIPPPLHTERPRNTSHTPSPSISKMDPPPPKNDLYLFDYDFITFLRHTTDNDLQHTTNRGEILGQIVDDKTYHRQSNFKPNLFLRLGKQLNIGMF